MKARLAFLFVAGLLAVLITGELYVSMRENAADEAVRKLNGIPEGEAWLLTGTFSDEPPSRSAYQGPLSNPRLFLEPDAELGYRLRANLRELPGRLRRGGATIYDVTYSTGRFGWRRTPQVPNAGADVLFLGGSSTFGQGVADTETLPARFSAEMKGQVLAHNFGVPGWGAQQSLRLLELSGEKAELMQRRVTKVFFFVNKEHVTGLVGESGESAGAPRYEVRNGAATFAGHLSDSAFARACAYSSLCAYARAPVAESRATPAELAAVIARMAELVKERYHVGLTALVWNPGDPVMDQLEKELAGRGVDVVPARSAIPDLAEKSSNYVMRGDGHPNARAFALLGTYLAQRLER